MKKIFINVFLPVILSSCLIAFFFNIKHNTHFNQMHTKNLADLGLNLDMKKHPFLKSLNNNKKEYKKIYYHMQPQMDGIDDFATNEFWTFEHNGQTYYAIQSNSNMTLKKHDEDLSRTHYYLSIYNSDKKLISEIVEEKQKYEKLIYMVFRTGNNLDATLLSYNPSTNKLNKKIHNLIKIPDSEYISGISDYLMIVPYNKVLSVKKSFCIYSEDELKLKKFEYKIINRKAKTKIQPWNIEFEELEIGDDSNEPIHSRFFYDTEKNVMYKFNYGKISKVLTDYNEIFFKEKTHDDMAAKVSIPLNFWLTNKDNLEEIKLIVTFNDKGSDLYIKKTPRQKIQKINDNTIVLTLIPENFTYKSSEKVSKQEFSDALESSLTYPANDSRVKALAHAITENAKDDLEKAFLIMNWIDANIKWTYNSNTEVLQTLDTKKGDCSERAALFITLARACGIPAAFSGGYVFTVDSIGAHAWVKVFENNRWIELDPSHPGFIGAYYLTIEPSLLPEGIKDVQVAELKYKNGSVKKIHRSESFTKHTDTFYSNRILGLSFLIPDYAKLATPRKISDILFRVSLVQNIFKLKSLARNYDISNTKNFVIISDYDENLFKASKYAKNNRFFGVEVTQRLIISEKGHNLLAEKLLIPEKNMAGVIYSYPLKTDYIISFLVLGDKSDINTLFLKAKAPPLFIDILKGEKRINQDY